MRDRILADVIERLGVSSVVKTVAESRSSVDKKCGGMIEPENIRVGKKPGYSSKFSSRSPTLEVLNIRTGRTILFATL